MPELRALYDRAAGAGLIAGPIQGAGLTEFGGALPCTAVAIGPDREDRIDLRARSLSLLSDRRAFLDCLPSPRRGSYAGAPIATWMRDGESRK